MVSRSPPLHSSQNRRTSSRGVSLMDSVRSRAAFGGALPFSSVAVELPLDVVRSWAGRYFRARPARFLTAALAFLTAAFFFLTGAAVFFLTGAAFFFLAGAAVLFVAFLTAAFFLGGAAFFLGGAFFFLGGADFLAPAFLGGNAVAWAIPRRSHRASSPSSATPAGLTRIIPFEVRPPIENSLTLGLVRASWCNVGSIRTMRSAPRTPQHRLPPIMKLMPPNISRSVIRLTGAKCSRRRSANSSSYATATYSSKAASSSGACHNGFPARFWP